MSKRYYIVAMMMLVHNIAWTINTGMYFIPIHIGTGVYSQKAQPSVAALSDDSESISLWSQLLEYPGEIGIHSDSIKDLRHSLSSDAFLNKPKLINIGLGYQFSSNFSAEIKPTALLALHHPTRNSGKGFFEKAKRTIMDNTWRYGISLSGQLSVPLTSSIRLYGKVGKVLYFYDKKPTEFDFKKAQNRLSQSVTKFSEVHSSNVPSFGGAGFYYQWSQSKIVDLSWECYLPSTPKGDYLHFVKFGLNLYL